jgi:hypothetical protein
MKRSIATVWLHQEGSVEQAELEDAPQLGGTIRLDTPGWQQWLEAPKTTSFAYPLHDRAAGWIAGVMTVRKERRARGSAYWVAYRRVDGQLRKIYLGRSPQVTGARLAAVAAQFLSARMVSVSKERG